MLKCYYILEYESNEKGRGLTQSSEKKYPTPTKY